MSNMKCPFCQQELDTSNYYTRCHNPHCNITTEMEGTEEMWVALVRTRKALDVAVDALKEINDRYEEEEQRGREEDDSPDWWDFSMDTGEILAKALEQITALEQKD